MLYKSDIKIKREFIELRYQYILQNILLVYKNFQNPI